MRLGVLLVFLVLLFSCKKDKPFGPQFSDSDTTIIDTVGSTIFVINEGNFTLANSSLTAFNIDEVQTEQNVFEKANEKSLGDIAQSLLIADDIGYVCINNSNLIQKIELPSTKQLGELAVASPRYSLITTAGELWVTSLNKTTLYRIDTAAFKIIDRVRVEGWLEQLIETDNHVIACNVDENRVEVYNLEGQLQTSIPVGRQPQSLALDNEGLLWVLCDGGFNPRDREEATLHRIDPISRKVTFTFTFNDIEYSPTRLCYSAKENKLFYINRGVYSFEPNNLNKEPQQIFEKDGANLYGLAVFDEEEIVVVADVKDYVKPGSAYVLGYGGKQKYDFETGIIPQDIQLYQ